MRLFTHNFLQCHVKGCNSDNYPLPITDADIEEKESEFNGEFLRGFLTRIDYAVLLNAAQELKLSTVLPDSLPEEPSEELLRQLHHVLFETSIINGKMTCSGCGHIYPIKDGIPNMLLSEDEV